MPQIWDDLGAGNSLKIPEGSVVPLRQKELRRAMLEVLEAIAKDVRGGLKETVGIESSFSTDDGRSSMILELPEGADAELVARAIDAENVEAWLDEQKRVHVGINPWYSTKDVDQTVLCTIKVIHVLLGIHATDNMPPPTLKQKLLASIAEIMQIQTGADKRKD